MTAAFLESLVNTCQTHLLEHKWLLAPNRRVGNQWKDQINFDGINTVNLHTETLQSVVLGLISTELATRGVEFASGVRCSLLIGKVFGNLVEAGGLSYLNRVDATDKLAQLLAKTLSDLRLSAFPANDLDGSKTEVPDKAADLRQLGIFFENELADQNLIDYPACLQLACEIFDSGRTELPAPLIVISPMELASCHLEREFLKRLRQHCEFVGPTPPSQTDSGPQFAAHFKAAIGEVNEVNLVLQNAIERLPQSSLDQIEVLHTDYSTYVPLIHESLTAILGESNNSIDELPVTFGEGIACIYSRPGRALRGWLRWLRHDCVQTLIVRMIREGLLQFDKNETGIGFASLASLLRRLPIGFGATRYSSVLADSIAQAKSNIELAADRQDDSDQDDFTTDYDFGLAAFDTLQGLLKPLIKMSPEENVEPQVVLAAARNFLTNFSRSVNKLDQYAKDKLLNDIEGMERAISIAPDASINIWEWLENLPVESRILASGPQPGRIHVDHIAKGGHSGRSSTFIIGLDDSRFPIRSSQDPLLLDFERQNISDALPTSGDANHRSSHDYQQLLSRLKDDVTFIFATNSLAQDRQQFPGSVLLDTFRLMTNQPTASLDEFESFVDEPVSFCPTNDQSFVSSDQWWHSRLASEENEAQRPVHHESEFQHFTDSRLANEQRASDAFTQFDGHVPSAGQDLDPTNPESKRVSPSRLETFGVCPRKFFFRYGLGITPPEEHVVDTEQWLDALALGSLVHEVFEEFLRGITAQNRIPELARDQADLLSLLHTKIDELKKTVPVPNEDAYQRQIQRLEKTCEIFLRREEEYCRTTGSVPWVFEASLGLGDAPVSDIDCESPVEIKLSDGRAIRVGGRIDRVDRIGDPDSMNFAVWDYKSGSSWGFDSSNPLKQGRKLQPYLYAGMLKHRLRETVGPNATVSFFGYFFPSPKTEGLRLQWTTTELKSGDEVLRHICDAIARGAFVATNEKSDCGYCDYLSICGEPYETAASSLVQLSTCDDPALDPMRKLRSVEVNGWENLQ